MIRDFRVMPRITLRLLLIVVTGIGLSLGWRANRLFVNRAAIQGLRDEGLSASETYESLEYQLSFWTRVNVDRIAVSGAWPFYPDPEKPYNAPSKFWEHLSKLKPLASLEVVGIDVPNDGGDEALPAVTSASFTLCRFRGNALADALRRMPMLKSLDIAHGELDSPELLFLSRCKHLSEIEIRGIAIPKGTIASLRELSLTSLFISASGQDRKVEVNQEDITAISEMTELSRVVIGGNPGFPLASVNVFKKCKKLTFLRLSVEPSSLEERDAMTSELKKTFPGGDIQLSSPF